MTKLRKLWLLSKWDQNFWNDMVNDYLIIALIFHVLEKIFQK